MLDSGEVAPENSAENLEELAPLLITPRTPFREVITTLDGLREVVSQLTEGSGDIALDAERASGFKYSQRAYLIQSIDEVVASISLTPSQSLKIPQ